MACSDAKNVITGRCMPDRYAVKFHISCYYNITFLVMTLPGRWTVTR